MANYPKELENIPLDLRSKLGLIIERARWVIQKTPTTLPSEESGDIVQLYEAPGGALQRVTPDWLLPLILRLNGSQEKTPLCNSIQGSQT
ncbi:VP3 [Tupaia glis polyomavirus 1]|nr:VP3 [Tupaia glis polyomavirus 1]AWD33800.1 VP3 [Tupaia glis polyomavirus 1]AWD33809.1 VP3 [Tupaia glis polyomavirus 1]AWD33818.1 VP3 [Tupaia glis polyomavirus 1]